MAFCICSSLNSVSIPSSMEKMADLSLAFSPLSSIRVYKPTPPGIAEHGPFEEQYDAVLYVPFGSLGTYKNDVYWGKFHDIREMDASGVVATDVTPTSDQGIYDMQGRRLNGAPSHGVYIRNGRKYVK